MQKFREINAFITNYTEPVFTKNCTVQCALLQPRSENYFRIEKKIGKKWQIFREIEAHQIIE